MRKTSPTLAFSKHGLLLAANLVGAHFVQRVAEGEREREFGDALGGGRSNLGLLPHHDEPLDAGDGGQDQHDPQDRHEQGAEQQPDDISYTFIDYDVDPNGFAESLTWAQLHNRVQVVAGELRKLGKVGDRAAILGAAAPFFSSNKETTVP